MQREIISFSRKNINAEIPLIKLHTLVLGSGAAGLNAALQLSHRGIKDLAIITEGLSMGTSINTGSDKQTYYKLSICGSEADSPQDMAETLFSSGSMHGDLALVESALSIRAFMSLVNLGIPFPRDKYGQFVGYKTDHDPRQRGTSIGPYTSKEMCLKLIEQVKSQNIEIREQREAIELITIGDKEMRICGVIALDQNGDLEAYLVENLVFAVGGPGGLYQTSVYPSVHTGAIGLALLAGADAANLPESQFGIASIKFRWNVSGTFMQVIPRVISRAANGETDEKEFLQEYFNTNAEMNGMVFLKGYQWPFDAQKVIGGSSIIDILVYVETVQKNRRVYLDFTKNPTGFSIDSLPLEAKEYLQRSSALQRTPIDRLIKMNPKAIDLYRDHGIDLAKEPLEIAVCAQHNNGGLSGNIWWESTNIRHLFPIGEVNGSHGVTRPGGSALNAGQIAGFRIAEYITNQYSDWSMPENMAKKAITKKVTNILDWMDICQSSSLDQKEELELLRKRMSASGAHIRNLQTIEKAVNDAWDQYEKIIKEGCKIRGKHELKHVFKLRQLCFAHAVYLDAIQFAIKSGVGSRGSAIILDECGLMIHPLLGNQWQIQHEDEKFRSFVLRTTFKSNGDIQHHWIPCRPIPKIDSWFETEWARYQYGDIYLEK